MEETVKTETEVIKEDKPTEKKVKKKTTIPPSQFDLQTAAQNVLIKWKATPEFALQWVKVSEYEGFVNDLNDLMRERTDVGSTRPMLTKNLSNLDKEINKAVEQVKIALFNKFGKEKGKDYFAEFGINKNNNSSYKLPSDRNQRLNILPLFAGACATHQIETPDYKKDFFSTIFTQYQAAFAQTQATDSIVTASVGNKNKVLQKVKEVLQALILLIKANYPKTYQNELRAWGFQKEKY